jgi:hypothetical protein
MQTYYVKFKCLITGQIAIAPVQAQSQLHAEYKAEDYPYCGPTYVVVRTV